MMSKATVKVGLIGCGTISSVYLENCAKFNNLEVVACADLDLARAVAKAAQYNVPRAIPVEELIADPEIQVVLNLTIPAAHGAVALAALEAGKSVYNEKPLAITREDARRMLELADQRGLRVGCAPDTFLGGGLQTCRKLIADGWIGRPVAATAFMLGRGPEGWHPDPEFLYQPGAGPLFDMGPYYLTALIALLGPVRRVTASAQISFPERLITSQPRYGTMITVRAPTHVAGVLDFAGGAVGTLVTSFDVWAAEAPRLEIYGADGSLSLPDPNSFGGPVRVRRPGMREWQELPLLYGYAGEGRGVGLADMAAALATGRAHRADGRLAYHVLDIMHAFLDASREGRHIDLASGVAPPDPLPVGLRDWEFTE
jgi:predicted dehydrogenase